MTTQHRAIEIDPAAFAVRVPHDTDTGEHIFDEADVLKFLIDRMNEAGADIAMIIHDHELAIEYQGQRDYFSMGITSLDKPDRAMIDGAAEISYILNDRTGIESWISYIAGKHALHILRKPDLSTGMTDLETREAEDNIEASE